MVRNPAVAGQFYSGNKEQLIAELDGMMPDTVAKIDAIAAVVPHAGYMYSGRVAGEVYARLEPKETYIILSPNHTGRGVRFASSSDAWGTPLGEVQIDMDILSAMTKASSLIQDDPEAHAFEHSVEVQIPFIQKTAPGSKIVPITLQYGSLEDLREVAAAISAAVKASDKKVMLLSSSDMTHYESRKMAEEKDKKAIEAVLALTPDKLIEVVEGNNITMCGYVPTAIMLMAAKELGAKKAELVKYADSGEVTGDIEEVVGYAGIIIS